MTDAVVQDGELFSPGEPVAVDPVAPEERPRWHWIAGFGGLLALQAVVFRITTGQVPDDAFIFYRYARNLGDGAGWVFNPGQGGSNGATAPAWTMLLALAGLLTDNLPAAGSALHAVLAAAAALVTVASLDRLGHRVVGLVAAPLIVVNPLLVRMRGMESAMFLLLLALVVHWGLVRRRPVPAGLAAGVLILTRPEGAVVLVLVLGVRWWRERRVPWSMAWAALVPVLPWAIFSWVRFDSPVAGTLAAKMAQERSGYFGPAFSFLRHVNQMAIQAWSLSLSVFALGGFLVIRRRPEMRDYLIVLGGFVALHVVAYGLVIRPPAYPWYYAGEYYVLAVLSGFGVVAVARFVAGRVGRRGVEAVVCVGLVLAYFAACFPWWYTDDHYAGYRDVAAWMRENTNRGDTLSATEIGVLGYYGDRQIVDYLGLLDRRAADEFARRDVASWFLRERPDYYLVHVPLWEFEEPATQTGLFSDYEPVLETGYHDRDGDYYWSHVRLYRATPEGGDEAALPDDRIVGEFADAGITLDAEDRWALTLVLARFLGSRTDQIDFDRRAGVDMAAVLQRYAKTPEGFGDIRTADDIAAIRDLALRARGRVLTFTIAPRLAESGR